MREEVEVRNRADSAVYAAEKMLKDNGDKIPADERSKVEAAIENVRKTVKEGTAADVERAMEELTRAEHAIAERMYSQTAASSQPAGPGPQDAAGPGTDAGEGSKKEDVIDAEFVDVEDKK